MNKTVDLNDEASLQYQNTLREAYVIVIDEPKEEFIETFKMLHQYSDSMSVIENYCATQLSYIKQNTTVSHQAEQTKFTIGGLEAITETFQGAIPQIEEEIAYHLTFIEGEENLFMIMSWTLNSRKEKYYPTYDQIASTFRLMR